MLNVQYHKFSFTFTPRNSSKFPITHDVILRDTIIHTKPKVLRSQSEIGTQESTEDLIESTRAPVKVETEVLDVPNDSHSHKPGEQIKYKHRKKRSRRQRIRSDTQTKLPRRRVAKAINFLHADNTTREARQILKANILELIDLKPTTFSDNMENDPYLLNEIEPYDVNDADKKKIKTLVNKDDQTAVIEAPDLAPKKKKRTEILNDIEDNFGVEYYSDQKSPFVLQATESNEDPSFVGAPLTKLKALEITAPMEASANIYYEDSSTCDQDTWQTIALRYMHGARAPGLHTRNTWKFNLKKQTSRKKDVALVRRLYRGYNDQHTPYGEQSLFRKNFESGIDAISFKRKPQKLKINDDGTVQYDSHDEDAKDDNVLKVTEIKEYDTILGPVPAPEIEIHTLPMQTALTYYKYKETSEALLPYTKGSPARSTDTERLWVYSLKKYATRPNGAITNTYLLINPNELLTTTNEPTPVDTLQADSTLYTYERIKAFKIKEAEERKKAKLIKEDKEKRKANKIKEAEEKKKAKSTKEVQEKKKAHKIKEAQEKKKTYRTEELDVTKQRYNIEEPDKPKKSYNIEEPVEREQGYKIEEPKPEDSDSRKKSLKGGKGSGNDWLYDVNDPDQVAYEMKVTEEEDDDSDIRVYARPMQQLTNIQRRWTYRETTERLVKPSARYSAVSSSHTIKSWMDYLKQCTSSAFSLDVVKTNLPALRENATSIAEELMDIEADPDTNVETSKINEIRIDDVGAKRAEPNSSEFTLRRLYQVLIGSKETLMCYDDHKDRKIIVNQKDKIRA